MQPENLDHKSEWSGHERAIPAVVLIAVGAIFFLNNLHIVAIREIFRFWPGILIAVGILLLTDSKDSSGKAAGGVFTGVGAVLLARNLGYINLQWREMWPLVLIGLGVLMLVDRTCWHIGVVDTGYRWQRRMFSGMRSFPKESTVFGTATRNYYGQEFNGGRYETVFGGIEVDLRGSHMPGEEAVIKIAAVFGGAEIKVPDTWLVVVRGTAFMGGIVNSTKAPDPVLVPNPKRLLVKGSVVFGGVEIKN